MHNLIQGKEIHIWYSGGYDNEAIDKKGIIQWVNDTAVCFISNDEEYAVPWTSIRFIRMIS